MDECGICLESKSFFNTLSCTHKVCSDCYPKLKTSKCPYCRTPFIKQTNTISKISQPSLEIDFEYTIYEFQSRRQKRRQKNKNNRSNGRPRKITNNNPISIFFFDGEIPNNIIENKNKSPKKNRNKKSNSKWNYIKNQQNF